MTAALTIVRTDGSTARLELTDGDITRFPAEAIVNAANAALAGGGGVDGAVHRAAGPELMEELRARYVGCPTGAAVITGAGKLAGNGVKYVIHAVGPRWSGGRNGEAEELEAAYRSSMELARDAHVRTIAFPAIRAGVYAFPLRDASRIALRTVAEALRKPGSPERATFVLYSEEALSAFEWALRQLAPEFRPPAPESGPAESGSPESGPPEPGPAPEG